MFNFLITAGIGADIAQNVLDMVDAGMTIASILSFVSTLGLGTAGIIAVKAFIKKKAFRTLAN